ncbi:hemerythrin domain-containing protein [Sphingomonas colocasiae]|uniref:Hemerythrin domain-containing protein n=1 Tax=Sphingomonas colocasiae TaxID=1848973 RepID=A0ABS7PQG6_9SPHN|nr:hemerythrin domain-containing protein [Sphingomonas colocasiae]MBY8823491.1 hemerythrin domain-containing protein [Sphingomonas colocasiae]
MATTAKAKKSAGSGGNTKGTSAFIGAAAIGVAAGLAANLGRKAIVQGATVAAGDWMEGLKAEHRATLAIFEALERTEDSHVRRRGMLLTQLKHALAKHAFQEENVVYPAMRQHGQIEAADGLNRDHGYVKQYLFELTELDRDSPAWIVKLRAFRVDLEKHVREEEDELFPMLHTALGEAGNRHVTLAMNKEGFKIA